MSGGIRIIYLFDPLCGWCYGVAPVLARIAAEEDFTLELLPTGMFAGAGARPLDIAFATFAWSNDQQIAALTGQKFSEDYRVHVLGAGGDFDSGAATLALTAVFLTTPLREREALSALQEARYVAGRDTADAAVVQDILKAGFPAAVARLVAPDAVLLAAHRERIDEARRLMAAFALDGIPALVVDTGKTRRLVRARELFADTQLLAHLAGGPRAVTFHPANLWSPSC
jgi:putative protein-disulfide isomerase